MNPSSEQELCLKGLFYHLVDHGFKLSVRDYIDGLKALRAGYGLLDRERLLWLCKTLWARTHEEERYITHLFGILPYPTEDEVIEAITSTVQPQDTDVEPEDQELEEQNRQTAPGDRLQEEDSDEKVGAAFTDVAQEGLGVPRALIAPSATEQFILTPKPALLSRELTVILRRYRRALRTGPATELDIEASIEETCRLGMLHKPVYIPARRNQARLTVLLDVSDSMIVWRSFNTVLYRALRNSNLGGWALYYFNNTPDDELYRDEALHKPVSIKKLINERSHAPLLIISDAGAARGFRSRSRIRETQAFLEKMRQFDWSPIAWVNPMPQHRWPKTSARAIERQAHVPMFELTADGLISAVDVLRGTKIVSGGVS